MKNLKNCIYLKHLGMIVLFLFIGKISFTQNISGLPRNFKSSIPIAIKAGPTPKASRVNYKKITQSIPNNKTTSLVTLTDNADIAILSGNFIQYDPSISIDPQNSNNILVSAGTRGLTYSSGSFYYGFFDQGYYYSTNGGQTWQGSNVLANKTTINDVDGWANTAYGSNSKAYLSAITRNGTGGYWAQTSTNYGATWGSLIPSATTVTNFDANSIAVDDVASSPYANRFYCAFNNAAGSGTVEFNKSTDQGVTFSTPIVLKNGFGNFSSTATGVNGDVYVVWSDYNTASDGFSPGVGFNRSINGGNTFMGYRRIINVNGSQASCASPTYNYTRVFDKPDIAVDKSNGTHRGRLYIAIPVKDVSNGKAIIQVSYSDNQGDTWSTLTTVNISTAQQSFMPAITVDNCTGDIWIAYYCFDSPTGFSTNTYVAFSNDGGTSWQNQKVSDVSHIRQPMNTSNLVFPCGFASDKLDIQASGGTAYAVWSDDRTYSATDHRWIVYVSKVTSTLLNLTISGSSTLCTTSQNYSISNLPTGATVVWSITPSTGATLTQSNNIATLTKTGNTQITLNATITVCGVTYNTAPKIITVGDPYTLYPFGSGQYQDAIMETGQDNGPCNIQCYSPSGPPKYYSAPIAYNSTSETWQKIWSLPANYSFWSANQPNTISLFFKASNQSVEFKRTLTGQCGVNLVEYYCFGSNTTVCGSLLAQTTSSQMFKIYPNPTSINRTVTLQILSNDKLNVADFGNSTIQLVDANDNIILTKQGSKNQKESLEIPALSNGIYYVRIINQCGTKTEKIIVKN